MGRVRWQPPASRLPHRLEAPLPAADRLVGRQAVLEEVQGAAGLEHPPDLAQGGADVGIVHSVQVVSAASKLSSGNGSDCPSSPARWTGMGPP